MAIKFKTIKYKPNDDGVASERFITIGPLNYESIKYEDGTKGRYINFWKYSLFVSADEISFYIKGKNKFTIDFHN